MANSKSANSTQDFVCLFVYLITYLFMSLPFLPLSPLLKHFPGVYHALVTCATYFWMKSSFILAAKEKVSRVRWARGQGWERGRWSSREGKATSLAPCAGRSPLLSFQTLSDAALHLGCPPRGDPSQETACTSSCAHLAHGPATCVPPHLLSSAHITRLYGF